ncbi:PHD/YefM family antitoxin component YafN of YafNO toxin-antitoxin module [Dyadobacter sp. BE34]|uniref:PHD/YefM family antitoxin component YafN of YafNO toxin-antitoxin module n=1 Tax=Dyadobacter fermentans TaxID=94254 RepID=A0ABU1QZ26_9BACT|nr:MULTISPECIES: type II toxin-antitoxin system Phd/YefM family antitoxin [Dyadobacter]MDR6806403.1 PHD/YefM family antitoxin component YafN of YafNO toxin-antitoxin module [Dyadobacter fermentans]MDR7044144.1 PHD/YefM family antitoxin component YafN of YafNO toxin-antitoxin module [Dyadobacter sp. BE242]MDR7198455.1 PHD/YefM family antitoxin component YafN of YafNO toxin-antitoxin module [Dyadobacter sp. BE34]MDR7216417.1 PHD/YefM family antitoxin component YafN of YafNO toxin-antitoxin module
MLVISSREFRDNQKKYMDLADNNQQVIIQRGKGKAYALTPVSERDRYFMDPEVMAEIREGIEQYRAGKTTKVDKTDLDQLLGL